MLIDMYAAGDNPGGTNDMPTTQPAQQMAVLIVCHIWRDSE